MKIRDRIKRLDRVKASDLLPNPRNWRTHPQAQQDALRGVLAEVGWVDALLVRETPAGLQIVDGHMRAETTPDEDVPVLVLDLDDAEADKVLATFDPIAGMAESDPLKLDALLREIDTGSEALQQMLADLAEEAGLYQDEPNTDVDAEPQIDKAEELRVKWGVEKGQLWLLGEHRLLCGDSTKAEDVERVMHGDRAFLMVTDPPYGVNLNQSWRDEALGDKAMGPGNKNAVANDDRADWTEAYALFSGDVAYVWHAEKFSDVVMNSLRSVGFDICQQLIWNKSVMVMGRSDYHFKHEPCWYAVRRGRSHGWTGDRTQTTVIDAKSPNHIMSGSDEDKTEHPTQKPVECMAYLIKNHKGDVYEPFSGSGTTLIACEQLNRRCRAIEISPAYVAVALQRYQDATGKTPTLAK